MTGPAVASGPLRGALVGAGVAATLWALAAMLGVAAILMGTALGGFVVIVLVAADAARLGALALQGLALVGPVSLLLLPALVLLLRRRPRLLRWVLVSAGAMAGGWWGEILSAWWLDEERAFAGFLVTLGMIGGLTAGIVFARRTSRFAL